MTPDTQLQSQITRFIGRALYGHNPVNVAFYIPLCMEYWQATRLFDSLRTRYRIDRHLHIKSNISGSYLRVSVCPKSLFPTQGL